MSSGPTGDRRLQAAREHQQQLAVQQFRKDVTELLQRPAFRRYVAHLVYGLLGLKKDPWRANAGETAKQAARAGAAVQVLTELREIDREGFILLEQEHVRRMAEELELPAFTKEQDDVP